MCALHSAGFKLPKSKRGEGVSAVKVLSSSSATYSSLKVSLKIWEIQKEVTRLEATAMSDSSPPSKRFKPRQPPALTCYSWAQLLHSHPAAALQAQQNS